MILLTSENIIDGYYIALQELKEKQIKEPTRMANLLKRPRVLISDLGVKISGLKKMN